MERKYLIVCTLASTPNTLSMLAKWWKIIVGYRCSDTKLLLEPMFLLIKVEFIRMECLKIKIRMKSYVLKKLDFNDVINLPFHSEKQVCGTPDIILVCGKLGSQLFLRHRLKHKNVLHLGLLTINIFIQIERKDKSHFS